MSFTLRGVGEEEFVGDINPTTWTHVVGVWGGGKRKTFINGTLAKSEDRSGAVNVTDSALIFGAKDNSGNYNPASPILGTMRMCGWMIFAFTMFSFPILKFPGSTAVGKEMLGNHGSR